MFTVTVAGFPAAHHDDEVAAWQHFNRAIHAHLPCEITRDGVALDTFSAHPSARPASHSDQDIDRHNAGLDPIAYDGGTEGEDDSDDPTSVFHETPRVVVTPSGIQFMLPGETPPPQKKGDDAEQSRMF